MNEHIEHLAEIFERFREANLKLHPAKCNFAAQQVTYSCHILSKDGVQADSCKIKEMKSFPQPTSQKSFKSFLVLTGLYKRYIEGYSEIVAPMLTLLRKDEKFAWDDQCQEAFEKLPNALISADTTTSRFI